MKKSIIALMGLFTLVACSEDVYDEIDQQNEEAGSQYQTNSFEDSDPGWINLPGAPFINPGSGYQSPWDIWFRNHPFTPVYTFSNRGGGGHTSPLSLKITPLVGLAYFDGNNDGFYHDDFLVVNNPPGMVADFTSGAYPNLFAGGHEVGNIFRAQSFVLDGTTMAQSELEIASDPAGGNPEHLLSPNGNPNPSTYNPNNITFQFPGLNTAESDLLSQYGKVFAYEVAISVHATGVSLGTFTVFVPHPFQGSGPINPNWKIAQANMSTGWGGTKDVYYYHNQTPGVPTDTQWVFPYPQNPTSYDPNYFCNSREVVIRSSNSHISQKTFTYAGIPWEITVVMPIGSHLWLTSGPYLVVKPL